MVRLGKRSKYVDIYWYRYMNMYMNGYATIYYIY